LLLHLVVIDYAVRSAVQIEVGCPEKKVFTFVAHVGQWDVEVTKENRGGGNIEPHVTLIANAASGCVAEASERELLP